MESNSSAGQHLLLTSIALRGVEFKNRIVISPMCTYAATDGLLNDFHLVHLGRFALGGAGLVIVEATAVNREGRISPGCSGLWDDTQIAPLKRIADFLHSYGSVAGVQLSHAGWKASTERPWDGGGPLYPGESTRPNEIGWQAQGVCSMPFASGWPAPAMLSVGEILGIVDDFVAATRRADAAGCDVIELHAAHGYLHHSFLSPLSNKRTDEYGGGFEGRTRFLQETIRAVRNVWPENKPLFLRISSVDGIDVGWSIEDSVKLAKQVKSLGVDVIDCSSGGMLLEKQHSLVGRKPGFHTPFSERIRKDAAIPTIAVGLIAEVEQAEAILRDGKADLIAIGREALFQPNWANMAAVAMEEKAGWKQWPIRFGWWLERRARSTSGATSRD